MVAVSDFRSVDEMARVISHNLWRLPAEADLIVAIPESGRLPAAFLGLQIGRRVVDLDRFLAEETPSRRVLLVDDVVATGATMRAARERIAARFPELPVTRLAVYCRTGAEAEVDLRFVTAPTPLLFEWSLFRGPVLARACLDLDGILCGDCPAEDDDDGPRYRRFLATAAPQVVPQGWLRRIVTARLEKYRPETEEWLARHRIDYGELVMLDLPSETERRRLKPQARFKAAAYHADPGTVLFVESESWQAREIAKLVPGKAVFDYQSRKLLDGAALAERGLPRRVQRRLVQVGRHLATRLPFGGA